MIRSVAVWLCTSSGIIAFWPALAFAQDPDVAPAEAAPAEAAPAEAPPRAVEPEQAPSEPINLHAEKSAPAEPVERSYHVHDGFYLRLNIGLGAYGIRYEDDYNAGGASLAFDVLAGGSPSKGFVIGGALLSDFSRNLSFRHGDTDVGEVDVGTILLGPFVDGFPNPKGGWHVGGMIGLAGIRTDGAPGQTAAREDQGGGGAVWFGYDAWVADEWSIGGLLRFAAAVGRSKDDAGTQRDSTSTALTLMFTTLYH
jgi:hypothetical protein